MSGRFKAAILLGMLALLIGAAFAGAEVGRDGELEVRVSGEISPHSLPRSGAAPVAVSIAGHITTADDSDPPQLKTLRIELNRHGQLDFAGLRICPYDRIQPASSARALAACRSSLVGRGRFWANIVLEGQQPYASQGQLLVFNSRRNGRPVLLGQIYSPRPFATSFVIVFSVSHLARGNYGTALTASLPEALSSWGYVTAIEMKLERHYRYRGTKHSYVTAGCPAPPGFSGATFPLARTSFQFAGRRELETTLIRSCRAR